MSPGSLRAVAVGVLVPVHGFAPFLAECLDAVLGEKPAVVVVVDDGSPQPLALDPDVVGAGVELVRRLTRGGPAAARATGLRHLPAAIDLVALCDADDAWSPGSLAPRVDALAATPDAAWCFGRALVVGVDGRPTGERWAEPAPGRHDGSALARALYLANPVPTSSVVLRRDAVAAAGGFPGPVEVAEDWELWLRLARAGSGAVCVPGAGVRYRRHPGGLTADVAALARAQQVVHARHGDLVDAATREAAAATDLAALADGLARVGDRPGARAAWRELGALRPLSPAERARGALLAIPGGDRLLGRADPYR